MEFFVLGCVANKLNTHPNKDATFTNLKNAMSKISPLASTLAESALQILQTTRSVFKDPALLWCFASAAHIIPVISGDHFKVNPKNFPNFANKAMHIKIKGVNVSPNGTCSFAPGSTLKDYWIPFLNEYFR